MPLERFAISAPPSAVEHRSQDPRRPTDDHLEVGHFVVVEPGDKAEPVAQRPGDEPGPGRRPDQGKARQVQAEAPRCGAFAEHDVELEVLHCGVKDLLHRPGQTVDLVHKEHVTVRQVGQQRRQVTGPDERRAGRDPERGTHFVGDYASERRLAEPRRPGEQHVVRRLVPAARRLDHDGQVLLQLRLPDELGQPARP